MGFYAILNLILSARGERRSKRSILTVNPAGKQALPRTAGVRGVMPTGFTAANISSKTAGRSGRLADRDGFR